MADVDGSSRGVIQGRKKSTVLARHIVNDIVSRHLRAGDRLAAEADMCAEYGVGRSTVREALRVLENQGVITIKTGPGGGPIIAPSDTGFLAANIALHLQLSGASFRDIMNARLVIEPAIAGAAAEHGDLQTMEALAAVVEQSHDDLDHDGLVRGAADFHDIVAAGSGNPFFEYLMRALHRITEPFAQRLPYEAVRRERLVTHHAEIAGAIASGDRDLAAGMMRRDLLEFIDYVEQEVPQLLDEKIDWGRVKT
jgi:GntR family transcriptional repressor for pyruvate dehydrogenase complex